MAKNITINQRKYDKKFIIKYSLKLHILNDKDIIAAIDEKNKQGSIKKLIRNGLYNRKE